MSLGEVLARLMGLEETQSVLRVSRPSLNAAWAHDAPAWLLFGCAALAVVAIVFYLRLQPGKHRKTRIVLAVARAVVLMLILAALAEPFLTVTVATRLRPALCLLLDGTDSMNIADDLPAAERQRLAAALGEPYAAAQSAVAPAAAAGPAATAGAASATGPASAAGRSRMDYVKLLLEKKDDNLLARLEQEFRLQAYLFDRPAGVRLLELVPPGKSHVDPSYLTKQITTEGQVTALGTALEDLNRRNVSNNLAGLVIVSDFNQNTGPNALEAARQLGVKIYTVGVGPTAALDVAVDIQAPLLAKKNERTTVSVIVHQQGVTNEPVHLKVSAQPLGGADAKAAQPQWLGDKSIHMADAVQTLDFPFTPDQTGQFELVAQADPLEGEVVRENNRATREITVRDDFIRLMFVEYEPTWEWRFMKEVFHRDKLVGMRGCRTFLHSADPKVRQTNELFLPTMSPPRSEFFAYDVIMLGDLPAAAISPRFCQMAEEFVDKFGGGLVVMAGPRFGPRQLAETPLAKMLPVVVDPAGRANDREPCTLRLRPDAAQFDFMQLGSDAAESAKAWTNLGELPWFQPVLRARALGTAVLAEHPTALCADGKTHQPLIALRRYGRGEVIYLAFDEMWRLRRKYGEQYYRQFWGQLIHRLALSHVLGAQKRFVVRTDRRRYQADDQVVLTIEAYDRDFQPLDESAVHGGALRAELVLPEQAAREGAAQQPLAVPQLRKGVFETRFPVYAGGEHRIRVKDPVSEEYVEVSFQVSSVAVERQRAVRNVALERALADATGGKTFDLASVGGLADQIRLTPKYELHEVFLALWNTRLFFGLVVALLLGEWLLRKRINLP